VTPDETLTIVLALKDRTPFTYRWMRYMNDVKCPYPILIADGGADQAIEAHLRDADSYPHLHYTYLRYPFDKDLATFYQKGADVVDLVSTPYVLLASNDDFFLMEHVPAFTRFLDANDGFVSCGGKPILLYLLSSDGTLVGTPSAGQYRAVDDDRPKSVTADDGVERVCYFLNNVRRHRLWSTQYQVHRTSAVKQASDFLRRHEFTDPVAVEIHLHVTLLMTGKYQQCDVPFWVNQLGTSQLTAALEGRANLVERFIMSNAFADVDRSLARFTTMSTNDLERIHRAIAKWFAGSAIALYSSRRAEASTAGNRDLVERLYRAARRLLRPLAVALRPTPPVRPQLRLAPLEKYILDPGP
jgi:glycosyltransferase domain-containing protein